MNNLKPKQDVSVHYEKNGEEWVMHGQYVSEDDESLTIKGTVGEMIGRILQFPKSRILYLEYSERSKLRDEYDEHWGTDE